jgi:hypothetical protein
MNAERINILAQSWTRGAEGPYYTHDLLNPSTRSPGSVIFDINSTAVDHAQISQKEKEDTLEIEVIYEERPF